MSIQKLHYENISGMLIRRGGLLNWRCPLCKAEGQSREVMRVCPKCGSKEAALSCAQAQSAPIIPEAVMEVIAGLVYEVERNICTHEETHRGGQWEICDMCGAKWADDRGGKPEFKWPEVVEKARDMLAAASEGAKI